MATKPLDDRDPQGAQLVTRAEVIVPMKHAAFDKKPILTEMRRQLMQNPEKLTKIVEELFRLAMNGNLMATTIIMDRLEGKAVQVIQDETGGQGYVFNMQFKVKGE